MAKCPICGHPMRGHPKCELCGILMGPGHYAGATFDVEGHGVCKACAEHVEDEGLTWDEAVEEQRRQGREPVNYGLGDD
jgi:hypothetical protein